MQELLPYQTFPSAVQANDLAEQLQQHGIKADVSYKPPILDTVWVGRGSSNDYILSIPGSDFVVANKILFDSAKVEISEIDPQHPLQTMTDDELRDVVAKPDEWGPDNYNIALALLQERKIPVTDDTLKQMEAKRISVLSRQKSMNSLLIVFGYAMAFLPFLKNSLSYHNMPFYVWYFPGAWGLIIGLAAVAKTTLPDGSRIFIFDNATRRHGLIISVLNIISWIVNFILFFFLM